MAAGSDDHWLEVERYDELAIVRLVRPQVFDDEAIGVIGEELAGLLGSGCRNLVLHFAAVQSMSSHMIGELIALQKKAKAAGGRLALCELTPNLSEIFDVLGLRKVFPIYDTEDEALVSFQTW